MAPVATTQDGGDAPTSTVFTNAKDAALRFLSYRARSEAEVRRRLTAKYPLTVVDAVIESLRRQKLVDDLSFARQWRASRERFRPRASRLVQQELRRLGVPQDLIEDSLIEFDEEANAARAAATVARRLAARNVSQKEFRGKLSAHLQRRGFTGGVVRATVEQLWGELGTNSLHCQGNPDDD